MKVLAQISYDHGYTKMACVIFLTLEFESFINFHHHFQFVLHCAVESVYLLEFPSLLPLSLSLTFRGVLFAIRLRNEFGRLIGALFPAEAERMC